MRWDRRWILSRVSLLITLLLIEAALFISVRWNPLLNGFVVFLAAAVFVVIGAAIVLLIGDTIVKYLKYLLRG